MGKSKNLKRLRKYADLLPVVNTYTQEKHIVKGSEMIANGQKHLEDGGKILPDELYLTLMPVIMPINHGRRMKQMYNKHGVVGAMSYIAAVREHSLKNKANDKI